MKKIKVFAVGDSVLMQKAISDVFSRMPDFEIVGKSFKGDEALRDIPKLHPDIVMLDVNLPDMYGLNVLKEIMGKFPSKVIMFSDYTKEAADITIKALELGALDFISKPSGDVSLGWNNFKKEIISKIKIISDIDISKHFHDFKKVSAAKEDSAVKKVVVIAASTGGPKSIMDIMREIPADIPASFLIVQHMPKGFTKSFASRIAWNSKIETKEASDGDVILKSAGYVAPAGFHMVIEKSPQSKNHRFCVRLNDNPRVNYVRPSADVTLTSVAELFGTDAIGVILTGMGKDGLDGAKHIKKRGGFIIAQDKNTSVVYGMPRAVIEEGIADEVLSLRDIPKEIIKRVRAR